MIELKVSKVAIPDRIAFNFEEIKNELAATMQRYENVVYTPDQMKTAKADKAALNKLRKALNDERIRREREYMKPFNEFKAQIAELIALIDKPVAAIDTQVKAYDEQKKAEKREKIKEFFESECDFPEWLDINKIFVPTWLNATCSMKTIEDDLKSMQETICKELAALQEMPAFSFEATEVYKQTLNLSAAINEGKRLADIQRRKEEAERLRAERLRKEAEEEAARIAAENLEIREKQEGIETSEPMPEAQQKQWISFSALLTVEQARELKAFFVARQIDFKAIC